MTVKRFLFPFLILACAASLLAQSSANYQIEQATLNNGGNPSPVLSSPNFQVTLDAIGNGLALTGMASASYGMDAGFATDYRPPEEVLNLRFTSKTAFGWNPEPSVGTYSVYRGLLSDLSSGYGSCFSQGLNTPQGSDPGVPSPGQAVFYLITAENRIAEEGTMGNNSAGTPRPNTTPCL